MRIATTIGLAAALLAGAATAARAQRAAAGDAYCDHVEAVAAAQSAVLIAPEVFGSVGYMDSSAVVDSPDVTATDLRLVAGVRYRLGGLVQGLHTRKRASAECRRHRALAQVEDVTTARALEARAQVLDEALARADQLLAQAAEDLDARRATAQEVNATRLRVDELRALAERTRRELDALPAAGTVTGAVTAFHAADADVERHDAGLRRAQGWDVSLRLGYDSFLGRDDGTPVFAMVTASINLGWFLQGPANDRAAAARRRIVQDEPGGQATERLRALLEREQVRAQETGVLVADLEKQMDQLAKIGGDASRRYRQTLWFEWVRLRAEQAYLTAHVASLREALGEGP